MLRILFLLFVVLPVVDLIVLYRLGERYGFFQALALALVVGAVGAAVAKREGLRVVQQWNEALASGRAPEEGVLSSALLLVAAGLLVLPGFLSDVLGIILLIPPARAFIARLLRARFEAGVEGGSIRVVSFDGSATRPGPRRPDRRDVIDVIDVVGEELPPDSDTKRPRFPSDPDRS